MPVQLSFVRPTEELENQPGKIESLIRSVTEEGINRALELKVLTTRDQAKVREADNVVDFGTAAGGWLTMPLLVAGNLYSVFATAVPAALTPQLATTRVAICYRISVETVGFPVDQISFREGAAAGTTKAVYDLEGLASCLKPDGFLSQPVVYDPQDVLNIVVRCRIVTGAQARVRIGTFIIERGGGVISP